MDRVPISGFESLKLRVRNFKINECFHCSCTSRWQALMKILTIVLEGFFYSKNWSQWSRQM